MESALFEPTTDEPSVDVQNFTMHSPVAWPRSLTSFVRVHVSSFLPPVLAAAVTQASLRSMLHKLLTAGPAFNITALLSAAQHSNQGMASSLSLTVCSWNTVYSVFFFFFFLISNVLQP